MKTQELSFGWDKFTSFVNGEEYPDFSATMISIGIVKPESDINRVFRIDGEPRKIGSSKAWYIPFVNVSTGKVFYFSSFRMADLLHQGTRTNWFDYNRNVGPTGYATEFKIHQFEPRKTLKGNEVFHRRVYDYQKAANKFKMDLEEVKRVLDDWNGPRDAADNTKYREIMEWYSDSKPADVMLDSYLKAGKGRQGKIPNEAALDYRLGTLLWLPA